MARPLYSRLLLDARPSFPQPVPFSIFIPLRRIKGCSGLHIQSVLHTMRVHNAKIKGGKTSMHRRINITLPEGTVRLIDRVAEKGDRSRLINEAVKRYVQEVGRTNLKKRLKEGAIREAELDLRLAEEWFSLEKEAWQERE